MSLMLCSGVFLRRCAHVSVCLCALCVQGTRTQKLKVFTECLNGASSLSCVDAELRAVPAGRNPMFMQALAGLSGTQRTLITFRTTTRRVCEHLFWAEATLLAFSPPVSPHPGREVWGPVSCLTNSWGS